MKTADIIRLSVRQLIRTGRRSLLTIIAVAIGVLSVVLIASCGNRAADSVSQELRALGVDGLVVYRNPSADGSTELPDNLGENLMKSVENIELAVPMNVSVGSYTLRGEKRTAAIVGSGYAIENALHLELLWGRFPTEAEINSGAPMAVVEAGIAEEVYGRSNIVGKTIQITMGDYQSEFTICGIIKGQKAGILSVLGENSPDFIYIPYTVETGGKGKAEQMAIRCKENFLSEETEQEIQKVLEREGRTGEYKVENICAYIERIESISQILSVFATCVGGIALLVAGVGVMNSMLASGELRKRETGIYLALGARSEDVLEGFLCEALLVSILGGICGTVPACVVLTVSGIGISWQSCVAALGVTILCGLLFGLAPAFRASRMQPVDIMRE